MARNKFWIYYRSYHHHHHVCASDLFKYSTIWPLLYAIINATDSFILKYFRTRTQLIGRTSLTKFIPRIQFEHKRETNKQTKPNITELLKCQLQMMILGCDVSISFLASSLKCQTETGHLMRQQQQQQNVEFNY